MSSPGVLEASKSELNQLNTGLSVSYTPSPFQNLDPKEHRALEFFVNCTAPNLGDYFSPDTWLQHIPNPGLSQSALRHAIVAIAAVHEGYAARTQDFNPNNQFAMYSFALQQYSLSVKSLSAAISSGSKDLESTLLCCALFVCFDSLRGNYSAATTHLYAGMKLLSGHLIDSNGASLNIKSFVRVFNSLGIQIGTFIDSVLPDDTRHIWQLIKSVNEKSSSREFQSIDDAEHSMQMIISNFMSNHTQTEAQNSLFDSESSAITSTYCNVDIPSTNVMNDLATWSRAFDSMVHPASLCIKSISLQLHHATLTALANAAMMPNSGPGNPVLDAPHEHIVALSRFLIASTVASARIKAIISSDVGVIGSLFVVIARCTVSYLRWEALVLLKSVSWREGMWDSEIMARIAMGVLEFEEKSSIEEASRKYSRLEMTGVRVTSNEDEIGDLDLKLVLNLDYKRINSEGQTAVETEVLVERVR